MNTLYDLSKIAVQIRDAIEQGLPEEEIDELLKIKAENDEDLREKITSYGKLVLQQNIEVETLKAEIERLRERANARENLAEKLKTALNVAMNQADIKKVENEFVTVRRQKKPVFLEILDEGKIPDQFRNSRLEFNPGTLEIETIWDLQARYGDGVKLKEEIAKKELNAWFKQTGEVVAGTQVRNCEYSIQIK